MYIREDVVTNGDGRKRHWRMHRREKRIPLKCREQSAETKRIMTERRHRLWKILELTALELGKKIKAGEITVKEAVQAVIDRAKEVEPVITSYVTLDEAGAFAQADAALD